MPLLFVVSFVILSCKQRIFIYSLECHSGRIISAPTLDFGNVGAAISRPKSNFTGRNRLIRIAKERPNGLSFCFAYSSSKAPV